MPRLNESRRNTVQNFANYNLNPYFLCYNNRFATLAYCILRSSGQVLPPLGAGSSSD